MTMYVAGAGRLGQLLARALSVALTSEHALLTKERLSDEWTGEECRFASAAADDRVSVDLALWDGSLDDWTGGVPDGYELASTGTGSVVEEGTIVRTGKSAKISGGATPAVGRLRRVQEVRTGEQLRWRPWRRGDGTVNGVWRGRIYNPHTAKYLQGDLTWAAASADLATYQTATWAQADIGPFTVESFSACGDRDTVNLYFEHVVTGTGVAYVDDDYAWPLVDWCSLHGHNLDGGVAVQLRSSNDNWASNNVLVATLTKRKPAFGVRLSSAITDRWVRVVFSGLNTEAIALAELLLAQALAMTKSPVYPIRVGYLDDAMGSDNTVVPLRRHPRRTLELPFDLRALAEWTQQLDEVRTRCRGRAYPLAVQYDSETQSDLVLYGRLAEQWEAARAFLNVHENSLVVVEQPFSTRVS